MGCGCGAPRCKALLIGHTAWGGSKPTQLLHGNTPLEERLLLELPTPSWLHDLRATEVSLGGSQRNPAITGTFNESDYILLIGLGEHT